MSLGFSFHDAEAPCPAFRLARGRHAGGRSDGIRDAGRRGRHRAARHRAGSPGSPFRALRGRPTPRLHAGHGLAATGGRPHAGGKRRHRRRRVPRHRRRRGSEPDDGRAAASAPAAKSTFWLVRTAAAVCAWWRRSSRRGSSRRSSIALLRKGDRDVRAARRPPDPGPHAVRVCSHLQQTTDSVLALFGDREDDARAAYRRFVAAGIGQGRRPDLTGSGLCRSRRHWFGRPGNVRGRDPWAFDERILGSSDFVTRVLAEQESAPANVSPPRSPEEVDVILSRLLQRASVCCGAMPSEVASSSRRPAAVRGRALISRWAVLECGVASNAVARFLGVSRQAVRRGLERSEGPEAENGCEDVAASLPEVLLVATMRFVRIVPSSPFLREEVISGGRRALAQAAARRGRSSTTSSRPSAAAIRRSVSKLGLAPPPSRRAIAGCVLPIREASSACVMPIRSRACRTRSPRSKASLARP